MTFLDTSVIVDYLEGIDSDPLSPRDMMIAATARSTGDELVVSDSDFQTDVLEEYMEVSNLRE